MLPAALRSTPTTETPELAKPATKRARAASVLRKQPETPGPLAGESRTNGRDLRLVLDGSDKDAPPRRSSRLNTTTTNKATAGTGAGRLAVARDRRATRSQSVQSAASVASVASSASGHDAASAIAEAAAAAAAAIAVDEWLRDIVRRCARAYRFLSMFQCRKALDEVDALAPRVGEWAWSLDIVARCFSEMGNHAEVSKPSLTTLTTVMPRVPQVATTGAVPPRTHGDLLDIPVAREQRARALLALARATCDQPRSPPAMDCVR